MAPEVLEFGHLNLPQQCMDILKEARRPTTRKCYTAKWKRFVLYCQHQKVNPLNARVQTIICYIFKPHI